MNEKEKRKAEVKKGINVHALKEPVIGAGLSSSMNCLSGFPLKRWR